MTDAEFMATCTESVEKRIACDFKSAVRLAVNATEGRPDEPSAWHTLAMAASDLGRHADTKYCRERAVDLLYAKEPIAIEQFHYAQQCYFGYATSLLLHGEFEKAWPYWETGRLGYSWQPLPGTRYWTGDDDPDHGLIVIPEGGYGDFLAFRRFLPELAKRYHGRIGVIAPRGMASFAPAMLADDTYELGDMIPSDGTWRYSISLMSLPAILQFNSPESWPKDRGWGDFLHYSAFERGMPARPHIGFCWYSQENRSPRRIRSLTDEQAARLALALGARGVMKIRSLVPDRMVPGVRHEAERLSSWRDTAAYMSGMDFILTVDTAVAHLAGLLGIPALCLLPLNVDWRWGLSGDTSFWYGPQFRLFRNQDPVEWDVPGIAARVVELLGQ